MRLLDFLLSLIALIIFAPALSFVLIALRLTGEGEVFYKQERVGRNNQKFLLLKFATMLKNSPSLGTGNITVKNDPRVLPFGKFLRKTKINELPQLINVLKGDMALIGPRPLTEDNFQMYSDDVQFAIQSLRPGLSGVGSIIFRNEEELLSGTNASGEFYLDHIAPYKGELEKWYYSRRNIFVDIMLIILTIFYVLFPSSTAISRVFPSLPSMPSKLSQIMTPLRSAKESNV